MDAARRLVADRSWRASADADHNGGKNDSPCRPSSVPLSARLPGGGGSQATETRQAGPVTAPAPDGHEARADDEDAFIAQGPQACPELEQRGGVEAGHRQLDDRNVGRGIHRHQGDERAVVETSVSVLVHRGRRTERGRGRRARSFASGVA